MVTPLAISTELSTYMRCSLNSKKTRAFSCMTWNVSFRVSLSLESPFAFLTFLLIRSSNLHMTETSPFYLFVYLFNLTWFNFNLFPLCYFTLMV